MCISDWSSDGCSSDLPSPLAWPLAYAWPVHRIGPDHQPLQQPAEPTLLLLRRESDGKVSFHVLSPLTFRLLERLEQAPGLSGREQLEALDADAAAPETDAFVPAHPPTLALLHREGPLLGSASQAAAQDPTPPRPTQRRSAPPLRQRA